IFRRTRGVRLPHLRSAVEPKTAFRRAWEILDSHPLPKWSALVAAVVTSFITVGLLAVLALFIDLLIHQGGVSEYADHPIMGWLARRMQWLGRSDDTAVPGFWYLTGLSFLSITLALLRAVAVFVMRYSAASAALSVATWLRRAIYHHTYRLGTLAIRPNGP